MILKDIHIDGFGIFNGKTIGNLRNGINIITGENEAGKSTLLKFIRYTLFGYPRQKDQRMEPLNGGNHGGRIRILHSSGREMTFERNGKGQITLYENDQPSQDEIMWFQALGNACDKIYENIYAFSLDELVGLQSLTDSGMEDRIFSIGSGLGNISVGSVSKSIEDRIESIYNPRGRQQDIPVILKKIAELKDRIAEIQKNLPAYHEIHQSIISLGSDHSKLEMGIRDLRNDRDRLGSYLKCYESFIAVTGIDAELSGLPELKDLPPGGPEKLDKLGEQGKALELKIKETREGNDESPGIEELQDELNGLSYNEDILKKEADADYLTQNLKLFIQAGKDTDEERRELEIRNKRISEELRNINSKWTEQDVSGFGEVLVHQDRIRVFRKEFEDLGNRKVEITADRRAIEAARSRVNTGYLLILFSVLALLGSLALFWLKLYVPAALCLAASIIIFLSRKWIISGNPLAENDKELDELEELLGDLKTRYQQYLAETLHMDAHLSPESVLEILTMIISLKRDISDRDGLNGRLAEKQAFIRDYVSKANEFRDILADSPEKTEDLVRISLEEFRKAKSGSEKKASIKKILGEKGKKIEKATAELDETRKQIATLLKTTGTGSPEEFRVEYRINDRITSLRDARKKEIATIETIAGKGESPAVIDFLESNSKEHLLHKITELDEEIKGKSVDLKTINTLLGEKRNELKHAERESELTAVMSELETEKQKLQNSYREWLSNKLALRILSDVRDRFEREKQPEVIRNSGRIFRKITGDRFERISASMDKKEILVFGSRDSSRKINQLSRGTREQLLISLRLGFIEEYETHAEPLPVIVDEIFVNFDPERTRRTAEIFSDFAVDRQVIIFTCHPSTAGYFEKKKINLISL